MLAQTEEHLKARAKAWQKQLGSGELIQGFSTIGGGSLPGETLPTWLLQLYPKSPNKLLNCLREQNPPLIARIQDQSVVLDPRSVQEDEDQVIIKHLLNCTK